MNEITKRLEENRKKREAQNNPPPKVQTTQVGISKWVWMLGALVVDFITGYAVASITTDWYGALWIAAGAGGLVYSEWLRERIGNNVDQRKIGEHGVIVSAVAVLVMAGLAGSVYILGMTKVAWVEIVVLLSTIGLFCYHTFQSYRYHHKDDDYLARTEDARAEEQHKRNLREMERAAREVKAAQDEEAEEKKYRRDYGETWDVARGVQSYAATALTMPAVAPQTHQNKRSEQNQGTSWTLADLTKKTGKTAGQMRADFVDYDQFAAWCSVQFDHISGGNMKRIWFGEINPTSRQSQK